MIVTTSDFDRKLNWVRRKSAPPTAGLVRMLLRRRPTRPQLPGLRKLSFRIIFWQFSMLDLPDMKVLKRMTWNELLQVNLNLSTSEQNYAISKSKLGICWIYDRCFFERFIPASSKLTIENTLDRSRIETIFWSFSIPELKVNLFSTSESTFGATKESPPGKKTLSISKKRNTCS